MTDVELPCRNIVNKLLLLLLLLSLLLLPSPLHGTSVFLMRNFHDALNNVEITLNGLTKDFYVRGSNESYSRLPENGLGRVLPRLSLNFSRAN